MIINLNVTGKEDMKKLADIASTITQDFFDEIPRGNPMEAQAVLNVYGMLAMNIVSFLMVNRAMNFTDANVTEARKYSQEVILGEWMEEIVKVTGFNFDEIESGKVKETKFP